MFSVLEAENKNGGNYLGFFVILFLRADVTGSIYFGTYFELLVQIHSKYL